MDRRDFIKKMGAGIMVGTGAAGESLSDTMIVNRDRMKTRPKARVAVLRDEKVRAKTGLSADRIHALLERAILAATGYKDIKIAMRSLAGPKDIVGIKLNCLAGRPLSPTKELTQAMTRLFSECNVSEGNLIFFERSQRDLIKGGFEVNVSGPGARFLGHDSPGCGYEPRPRISGQVGSCLSRIVTEKITVLINLGVLKDHNLSGISAGMKNLFGIIHNPNKYHDNNCDPYVADVSAFDVVRAKLRLVVIDALLAQCEGGPAYRPQYAWPFNGVLVSTDSVAVDRVGLQIIEAQRKKKGLHSLKAMKRHPQWLETASRLGLGECNHENIQIIEEA